MKNKSEDIYADLAVDVQKRFDTSNYDAKRPLPVGKNEKGIGLIKDELGAKIMKQFVALRPKSYSYLTDGRCVNKETKVHQNLHQVAVKVQEGVEQYVYRKGQQDCL